MKFWESHINAKMSNRTQWCGDKAKSRWGSENRADRRGFHVFKAHSQPFSFLTFRNLRGIRCPFAVFLLSDALSFSGLASKIQPLGSMFNFDADVKKTTARHQCENPHSQTLSFVMFHSFIGGIPTCPKCSRMRINQAPSGMS